MCQPNINVRIAFLQSSTLFRISKANSKLNADRLVLSWSCSGDPISAFLSRLELQAGHYTIWHLEELWVSKLLSTCLHGQMFNHWAISPGWEKNGSYWHLFLSTHTLYHKNITHLCAFNPSHTIYVFQVKKISSRAGEKAQWEGTLASNAVDQSSIPGAHMVERESYSGLHAMHGIYPIPK